MDEYIKKKTAYRAIMGDRKLDNEKKTEKFITYEERRKVYYKALAEWGDTMQMIVAIEELSECQKEICKILRGGENFPNLAEEIADATIMLEQLRLIFNINDQVRECMDEKVRRLEKRLEKCGERRTEDA